MGTLEEAAGKQQEAAYIIPPQKSKYKTKKKTKNETNETFTGAKPYHLATGGATVLATKADAARQKRWKNNGAK